MVGVRREEVIDHIGSTYWVYIHQENITITTVQCDIDGGLTPCHTSMKLRT